MSILRVFVWTGSEVEPKRGASGIVRVMIPTSNAPSADEHPLSTDLSDPESVPYFLWDEPMSVAELRRRLTGGSEAERTRLLAKILREARDTEVWTFTTPEDVQRRWNDLAPRLGRRRRFWEFLLSQWRRHGLLSP